MLGSMQVFESEVTHMRRDPQPIDEMIQQESGGIFGG